MSVNTDHLKRTFLAEIESARSAGVHVERLPGLSDSEMNGLVQRFGEVSNEVRDLLRASRGIEIQEAERTSSLPRRVDFGASYLFGWEVLPRAFPIAEDGFGNYWVADASTRSGHWEPILFVSHDPAVVVVQARDLPEFMRQVFAVSGASDLIRPEVDRIWENRLSAGLPTAVEARRSSDAEMKGFAQELAEDWRVADLRACRFGDGFALTSDEITKHPRLMLFGLAPPKRGILSRLLGRRGPA